MEHILTVTINLANLDYSAMIGGECTTGDKEDLMKLVDELISLAEDGEG